MAESTNLVGIQGASSRQSCEPGGPPVRHTRVVRITHWMVTLCFFALLVTGIEIVISHPRFYWGEEGNVNTPPWFSLPIPSSRGSVPTGYAYVLPDQNGWSRALHFQTAWILVPTGLYYLISGLRSGHVRRNLMPASGDISPLALLRSSVNHLRFRPSAPSPGYNPLQRISYLIVILGAFPLVIWTGLAMSPAFTSAFPFFVEVLGGHQSARTLHFFATVFLTLFLLAHLVMIYRTGFGKLTRAMITGNVEKSS